MDFRDSAEQTMLRDTVRRFAAAAHPFRGELPNAPSQWASVARNGWPAIALSEDVGGLGFSPVDICILFEEFGRGLVAEPNSPCLLLAAGLVDRLGSAAQRQAHLPDVIEGRAVLALAHDEPGLRGDIAGISLDAMQSANGWTLKGRKIAVIGAARAQALVVSARTARGISAFLVSADRAGVLLSNYDTIDGLDAADVEFADVKIESSALLGDDGSASRIIETVVAHAIIAACAESVGSMERVLHVTRDYVTTRRQFGKPLATLQAVQHRMADMFVETEMSRSALYAALADITNGGNEVHAAAGAMALIAKAARLVCESGIQLHGGMGMAEASEVGHHYRRALAREAQFGHADRHLQRYATLTQGK